MSNLYEMRGRIDSKLCMYADALRENNLDMYLHTFRTTPNSESPEWPFSPESRFTTLPAAVLDLIGR